ncbi:hypothetical protein HAX54_012020 [Datura stramonium]|uniref:Uncharacterized protein n=1 Tax=Datura stramonium TaxID=4076 RepID=A0ABS8Y0V7_DATST|nr:hypothetical protein [Datura stramonium]
MAKGGKLKSVLKKMQSFKIGRNTNINSCSDYDSCSYESHCTIEDQHSTVYVGKSRRQYLVSTDVICHPLFMELAERSGDSIAVGCEVVLFEHLLWMLENADPQPESLDELGGIVTLSTQSGRDTLSNIDDDHNQSWMERFVDVVIIDIIPEGRMPFPEV